VTICACIFLKEKVDKKQVIGIILMLIAVVFVIKPSFSPEVIPSLAGLFSAVLAGFSYTIIRYLYGKVKAEINVFYFSLLSVVCTFPLMMMNFVKPNLFEIFMLIVGIGVSAAMGQFGLTYAYTFAPASEVSIYNYVIIITSMLMDYILFSTIPDLFSFIGGFIIMTTAIYLYLHNKKKEE
jgi:DMT superfamily drug/metabolite transporter